MIRCARLQTRPHRRPALTIAIVTFCVLVLELTCTRLFAYVGSAHATSTALSIAMLGLGLGAFVRVRAPSAVTFAAPALAAALLVLAVATIAGASLAILVALALATFCVAGSLVADAYAARGAAAARATYAIDLFAAAAGCVAAPLALGPLSPTEIVLVLGLACCTLVERRGARTAVVGAVAVAHVALLIAGRAGALPDGPLAALLRTAARGEKAIVDTETSARDVLDSAWTPLGRLDVHRTHGDPDRLGVFTDGMSPTFLVKAGATAFEDTWGFLMSLPYRALRPARVLVLGAGAGASVWLAKKYGAAQIDAVEVSPAIPDILARWRGFGGDVYHQPGVRLVVADARRFLADTSAQYDVIELALALTGNAHAQPAGLEAHLYTVEAVQLCLRRLTPTGALVLVHSDPGNAFRHLRTVIEAFGGDRARALEGIAVLRDPRPDTAYRYLLVVRTSPMPLEVADALDVPPAELLWGPGDPPERGAALLDGATLGATDADDLAPVHDERPYFFQNTKGLVATARAQPGRLWVLAGALVLVVLLAARSPLRPAAVASTLGAAFLCIELALIQRFTLAAGGTLYAVSFVLFALLAWSGAGALAFAHRLARRPRGLALACLAAALAIVATALVDLAWLDAIPSTPLRLFLIALLLAPTGLALGGPFPILLAGSGDIARLWALNGAASVAGGIVAVLSLRVWGSTETSLLAAALYVIAAIIAVHRP